MGNKERQSIRIPGYDYSQPGIYFVTVCSYQRRSIFGSVTEGEVFLQAEGLIVMEEWLRTEMIRPNVKIDTSIVMPNHFHGIVHITKRPIGRHVGAHCNAPLQGCVADLYREPQSLGSIIALFKGSVTRRVREMKCDPSFRVWQRNYYEHVIRNEVELNQLRLYIAQNPLLWELDPYHSE